MTNYVQIEHCTKCFRRRPEPRGDLSDYPVCRKGGECDWDSIAGSVLEARLHAAQNEAAIAAFEAFRASLAKSLRVLGADPLLLDGAQHLHLGLLIEETTGDAIAAGCAWSFSANPELLRQLFAFAGQKKGHSA